MYICTLNKSSLHQSPPFNGQKQEPLFLLNMVFFEIIQNTAIVYALFELFMSVTPLLWVGVAAGVVVGWAWKPKWANLDGVGDWFTSIMPSPLFPPFNGISFPIEFSSVQNLTSVNFQFPGFISWSFQKEVPEFTHAPRLVFGTP